MAALYRIIKVTLFCLNIICLILAIVVIFLKFLALEKSLPSTDEHTYFIVGIILSFFFCMSVLIGCYGLVSEILGFNIVYSVIVLILVLMQYQQMHNAQSRVFYLSAVKRLDQAWQLVNVNPYSMSLVESTYFCCGLYNSHDYNHRRLKLPKSCYMHNDEKTATILHDRGCLESLNDFYESTIDREKWLDWTIFGTKCLVFIGSVVLCLLLTNSNRNWYLRLQRESECQFVQRRPALNHVNSRTHLLSS